MEIQHLNNYLPTYPLMLSASNRVGSRAAQMVVD